MHGLRARSMDASVTPRRLRLVRSIAPGVLVCAVVLAVLVMVPLAHATQALTLTVSPPNPVAGDTVTAEGPGTECVNNDMPTFTFTFTLHHQGGPDTVEASGTGTSGPNGIDYSHQLTNPGPYTVDEHIDCPEGPDQDHTFDFTVAAGLGGSISVNPDPAVVNQQAALAVATTGGNQPYSWAWDLDNDGKFNDSTSRTPNYTFTTTGSHTVSVQITDNAQHQYQETHTTTITRTIDVVAPTSNTPPPPPPPCTSRVAFQLSEFTTDGCFTQTSSDPNTWTTTSAVRLNGILFPDFGQTFVITEPTPSEPGGHFTAPNSSMQLDNFTIFSGSIDWSLPAGGPGDEQEFHSFSVAAGASLVGLSVRGAVALNLGEDGDGNYYSTFGLSIQLPAAFNAGPDPSFGSVTGSASLRVDNAGIHYDGLRLEAENVWLGKIKVISTCFSYVPAGGMSTAPCDTPSFDGGDEPFIQCNTDANTNRWDASAVVELPSGLQLGAFGGLADGKISKLGGSVGNLEHRVPIASGVYLDHVAFGLCLSPPPFKIRANIGANFLAKDLVNVSGGFTYTDGNPWNLQLDGTVTVADTEVGTATMDISPASGIDFDVMANADFLGIASIDGEISGFIDAPHNQFLVSGDIKGCLTDVGCAEASAEVSSTGVAGCLTIGSSIPTYDLHIPLDGSAPYLDTSTHPLTAGFGYVWGASTVDLLGGSCDFASYEPVRGSSARVAGASSGRRLRIAAGTKAVSLRIHGTDGPPKVVLHGPHGVTISSPMGSRGRLSKGHYLLAENKTDGTTNVMVVRPAAGTWTVSRESSSGSSPTKIDRASLETPPTFGAHVSAKGGVRVLRVAYAVPAGTSVQLVERAKGLNHTIAARLRGRRCVGLPRSIPHSSEKILCASVHFRPSNGPGGTRKVQAVVTRRGIPLFTKTIVSFRTPRQTLPSGVGALRALRGTGYLMIQFAPSAGASRYSVSAKLSDGRELAFDLAGRCRALRIPNVPASTAASVKIAGVRYDLALGRARSVSIKANVPSAGRKSKKLRAGHVCT